MRHLKSGRKLGRTHSHRAALLDNLATALFEHKKIATTEAKAKELRPFAESLITKAKLAIKREKAGLVADSLPLDVHSRRVVARHIRKKAVVQELFDTIAPMVADRPGGYTRIVKTGFRRGDGGRAAIIELVDWSAAKDGASKIKGRRKGKAAPAAATPAGKPAKAAPVAAVAVPAEEVLPIAEVVDEPIVAVAEPEVEEIVAIVEEPAVEETIAEVAAEEPVAVAPAEDAPADEAKEEDKKDEV
jgi:large subunit ribosomal protein L17